MAKTASRRKKGRHRGASARANADLNAHIASLGLDGIAPYRTWCHEQGLNGALNKPWKEQEGLTLARGA